jgi:hypothetical protein
VLNPAVLSVAMSVFATCCGVGKDGGGVLFMFFVVSGRSETRNYLTRTCNLQVSLGDRGHIV